ncbi:signal transduction histidine kinase [Methanococcus maripaludis]|uniref:histidine kinase n=1 Tax=Methanococcus maripaludis TaxID=39152 RepID=A0A7J9S6P7_METMI|nr:ATP-binding protein [Methanococcus maripaludis]MBB6402462.1 signal transduction histidine kinase [Methanococcus maripaludis]
MVRGGQKLKFKVSSGLKDIIGKEMITNDLIAIFELVKNSYDAEANESKIIFDVRNKDPSKNEVCIVDDGYGMTREDIVNKFLFLAHSEKKSYSEEDYRNKMKHNRQIAGAKGIGRFSCDRLGKTLKMYTKTKDESIIRLITINWNNFEKDSTKEFQEIDVDYQEVDQIDLEKYRLDNFEHGTILEIQELNDNWDFKKFLGLKRYLQRLINPAQISKDDEFKIYLEAMGLDDKKLKKPENLTEKRIINGWIDNSILEKIDVKTARISTSIDESGEYIITELYDEGEQIFRIKESNIIYPHLKNISITLYYLNRKAKRAFTTTMGIPPVQYGSIFLYKNGMRVHPYGDEGDDWLSLEIRRGQGYARYLAGRDLMGRIELNGYQPDFNEVSSRDGGLVKNEHFDVLKEFYMKKAHRTLERYVVEAIDWDRAENQREKGEEFKTASKIREDSIKLISLLAGQVKDPNKEVEYNKNLLEIYKKKQQENVPEYIKNIEESAQKVENPVIKSLLKNNAEAIRKSHEENLKEKKLAEEQKRKAEIEKKLAEEQKRRAEEERKLAEEQKRRAELEKKRAEEERKLAEEQKRKAEIEKKLAEEQKRRAELEKKRAEEERKLAEEEREQVMVDLEAETTKRLFLERSNSTDHEIVESLNHSIEQTSFNIKDAIERINKTIRENNYEIPEPILSQIETIFSENLKIYAFSRYASHANFKTKPKTIKGNLISFIEDYVTTVTDLKEMNATFEGTEQVFKIRFPTMDVSVLLDNFISNSKKAGAKNIKICFSITGGELHLLFSDDGHGIPESHAKYVFDRGYTTTDGSGIGLRIVHNMAEEYGWDVKFNGNNLNNLKGACFEVVFK